MAIALTLWWVKLVDNFRVEQSLLEDNIIKKAINRFYEEILFPSVSIFDKEMIIDDMSDYYRKYIK